MARRRIDKRKLVAGLPVETDGLGQDGELSLEQMSLARSLLKLANIDLDRAYQLCRSLAERLLKSVPEPDELELD